LVKPKSALPVDTILPEIIDSLRRSPNLVIEAPPGAGKTTRVPPALLAIVSGEVVVLEPRRIAARLAARRVAWEAGEQVGETVGYQVRFEEAVGPRTKLRFVTEGVLTRRLLSDPGLRGVADCGATVRRRSGFLAWSGGDTTSHAGEPGDRAPGRPIGVAAAR
jgi:ATP-dependent helicase HrpB